MVAPNYSKLCEQAEQYYYDFLFEEAEQPIPIEVINHIVVCSNCREQINQLEGMLAEYKGPSKPDLSHRQTAVTAILKLHFSYTGQNVTCKTVRPFLPSLLDPALQIRIPTPITAHIDNCEQCKEDLEHLRELNLSPKQLKTLSRLFSDDLEGDETTCEKARESFAAVVAMAFDYTDAKTLRHLSLCPNCREELYKFREEIVRQAKSRRDEGDTGHKRLYCPSVTAGDVFDYCIPYNIDPASDEYAKFRKSLTTHIVCCADCLDKIQQLHRVIYGIIDKPESGVATVLHFDTSVKAEQQAELDNPYANFPVKVEVADLETVYAGREQSCGEEFREPVKLKSSSKNLRPFLKIALPVAALIVVALGLWFNAPTAKALNIEQIYTALDSVRNIYIARFAPDKQEPVQEIWLSRSLGFYVTKTEGEFTLWNIAENVKKTKILSTSAIERTSMSDDTLESVRTRIYGSLGIMPFSTPSDIPKEAKWSEITKFDHQAADETTELYELAWNEKAHDGTIVQRNWRVIIDTSTKLPKKVQWFSKSVSDAQPVLELTMAIEYPSDQQMQNTVDEMSF